MTILTVVSVLLLAHCYTVVCDCQESDPITGCQLREEIKKTFDDYLLPHIYQMSIPGYTPSHPAGSCKEILQLAPNSPSRYYWIGGTDDKPEHMYCDMERSCKGVAGGWMRVASVDMTDKRRNICPPGLKTITTPRRLCAKNISDPGCSSVVLPLHGVEYSQVCGKIIGYQNRTPDAFHRLNTQDDNYVDGISITHGQSPRRHIWTFAAAVHERNSNSHSVCPCTNIRNSPPPPVPDFVGDDYFCDTGSENHYQFIFYGDDPLWDGAGCGQYNTCCDFNSPPWFRKEISSPTSDDIEIRLCTDQDQNDEDINFETLEIYVQ